VPADAFEADTEAVLADLQTLKGLLEAGGA
jgi:hypothetical protein